MNTARNAPSLAGSSAPLANRRHRVGGLVLGAVLAAVAACSTADGAPTTPEEITAAYQKQRQAVRSIVIEYEVRAKALADMEILKRELKIVRLANMDVILGAKGDLRYYHVVDHQSEKEGGNPPERTLVYDGTSLRELRLLSMKPKHQIGMVQAVRKDNSLYFPSVYTGAVCLAVPDPGEKEPGSVTSRDRIPEMFKKKIFAIAAQPEPVDGENCVVLHAEGWQKLWLDPKIGYAARRREFYDNGNHAYTVQARDFEQVLPDLWLPRQVSWQSIAPKSSPAEYRGKPLHQNDVRVRRLEVNNPANDALFSLKYPQGLEVFDETLASNDPTKVPNQPNMVSPTVGYIQPANEADLESVISEAKGKQQATPRFWYRRLFLINALIVCVIVAVLLGRRWSASKPTRE